MKLESLDIRRLPGLDEPFSLRPGVGVNLVVGPNASGKSSVARAVRDLLWPERHAGGVRWLRAVFRGPDAALAVTCDGAAPVWTRDGAATAPPVLPPAHLADCYRLTAADLLGEGNVLDRDLAAAIRTEMTGGFDLDRLVRGLDRPPVRALRDRERALREARGATAAVERAQAELAGRRDSLEDLQNRVAAAEAAARRRDALEAWREALIAGRIRDEAKAALAAFPAVMPVVRGDDDTAFARLRETLVARRSRMAELARETAELDRRSTDLAVPSGVDAEAEVTRAAALVAACRKAGRDAELSGERRATLDRALRAASAASAEGKDAATGETAPAGEGTLAELHRELANLDATLAALEGETAGGAEDPGGRASAVVMLAAAGGLAVLAALPLLPAPLMRLLAAAGTLVLGALGIVSLVAWSRRRALHEQRVKLVAAAGEARTRRGEVAARADELAAAEAAAAEARSRLAAELAAMGQALAPWELPVPATVGAAEAALEDLRSRVRRRAELVASLSRARRDHDEAVREAEAAADQLAALLNRLQLPPDTGEAAPVQALVEQVPAWRAADEAWRRAEAAGAGLEQEAARRGAAAGLPAPAASIPELEAVVAAAADEAAQAAGLREQLGSLRQELRTADAGHALAAALARERAAQDDLAASLDEARDRLAEAALAVELRERHETLAAPPRLREANRLLGEFTRGRYALSLADTGAGPAFAAEDLATGRRLGLADLSDGTRTQVLLAVRVAFIGSAEPGARPPLFLDEALTTSDPERLAAVAASLGRLAAATDRQVFYLTSQPADVGAWRAALGAAGLADPTILDLAVARRAGTAAGPDQLAPAAAPAVPAPDGRGEADYGVALGVRVLDPLRPWQEADTFHLAAPDLVLAHRLRVAGLVTAGVLAAALPGLERMAVADAGQRERLERALAVLRALLSARRIGRPRPVEIADVDASEAVSAVFRPRVLQLLHDVGWDAARFLDAVAAGDIQNFRRNKLDVLREHLAQAECLDERAPLDGDQLVAEVMRRVAATPQTEARTSPLEVRALVHRLLQAMPQRSTDESI